MVVENLLVENRSNVAYMSVFGGFDIKEKRSADEFPVCMFWVHKSQTIEARGLLQKR